MIALIGAAASLVAFGAGMWTTFKPPRPDRTSEVLELQERVKDLARTLDYERGLRREAEAESVRRIAAAAQAPPKPAAVGKPGELDFETWVRFARQNPDVDLTFAKAVWAEEIERQRGRWHFPEDEHRAAWSAFRTRLQRATGKPIIDIVTVEAEERR